MQQHEEENDNWFDDLEDAFRQLEEDQAKLDVMFENLYVLQAIVDALYRFRSNLQEVETILTLPGWHAQPFLLGHIYSATVGAYEVFMRELLSSLLNSDEFYAKIKSALAKNLDNTKYINIRNLTEFRKNPSKKLLLDLIYNATFIDAQKITNSVKLWFELELPVLERSIDIAIKRNIFTHNGGMLRNGSSESTSVEEILALIENLDDNIAKSAKTVTKKIEILEASEKST